MKLLSIDSYIDFKCIGGDCPISCCGGNWGITIDDESYNYYMSIEGGFGDVLRNNIVKINETNMFKLDEHTKDCMFLDENKLCCIYKELGENALCETCRTYPRGFYQAGDIEFCYLSNSCPEVNRMIIQSSEIPGTLYDDTYADSNTDEMIVFDRNRFDDALRAFNIGMHLVRNTDVSLCNRLFLVLFFIDSYQEYVKKGKDTKELLSLFSDADVYRCLLDNYVHNTDHSDRLQLFTSFFDQLVTEIYNHPMWNDIRLFADKLNRSRVVNINSLDKAFEHIKNLNIQRDLERLMVYRFFVVFMQGYEKTDYSERYAYEIIVYIVLVTYMALGEVLNGSICLQDEMIRVYSLLRRIDHTKKLKEKMEKLLICGDWYTTEKLVKVLI